MAIAKTVALVLTGLALILTVSCSQSYVAQGNQALKHQNYQQALAYFEQALQQRPNDPQVQRSMGQIYFHQGDYDQSEKLLKGAQTKIPHDGTVILYLGMIAENKKDYKTAADLYGKYLAANKNSSMAPQIRGRLLYVQNEQMRHDVDDAIKSEKSLATETGTGKTVGVLPFTVPQKSSDDVRALADGMAAAMWYDLSTVKELQVVERLKMNYINDELQASSTGFTAKDSGPRFGKIVRAQNLVTANLNSPAPEKLDMQGGLINTTAGSYSPAYNTQDQFSKAISVQKQLTLAVLDSLGIKVTGSALRDLKKAPTDSYNAFLAFGHGVEQFDRGEYALADNFFKEAARIDPSFGLAKEFHGQAVLMQAGSTDLQRFSVAVLAGLNSQTNGGNRADDELFEISGPETDPRHQDIPSPTSGSGSATVSGSVR